jgi:methionine-gamma-lyase
MAYDAYHKRKIGNHVLRPETQMMGYGYDPTLSEGSLKPPIFLTSTFVFPSAQAGKDFFDITSGRKQLPAGQTSGLVYSRFNNPNLEVLEDRLALWEGAEMAAVFSSGMSAITTALLAYLRPGDVLLYSRPIYGGTETLIEKTLPNYGIIPVGIEDTLNPIAIDTAVVAAAKRGRIGAIMLETPANPTNSLVDLAYFAKVADGLKVSQNHRPVIMCDNTFLGPVFQKPLLHGVDLVIYSLTKYVGGHSDLVAGGVAGARAVTQPVKQLRGALGTQLDPNTAWMIMRSLETLAIRMERSAHNAKTIAEWLVTHPKIASVNYHGLLPLDNPLRILAEKQSTSPGSTFSFYVKGGELEAFKVLDNLQVMKLAVSLGGTETLISHPASTTHSGVQKDVRERMGVLDSMIRISVGIEHADDLIADLSLALSHI